METVLAPPSQFQFDENSVDVASGKLCDSWERWKKGFTIYFNACELSKKTPAIQLNIFLHIVGEQCREILEQSNETTLDGACKKLDEHFQTKKNLTVERHKFFTREQQQNESIDQYVFDLRKLSKSCEFGHLNDDLIKDRLVCGVTSPAIRERLLREGDLTLNKALEICRAAVVSRMYSDNIKKENEAVHSIKQDSNKQEENNEIWALRRNNRVEYGVSSSTRTYDDMKGATRSCSGHERGGAAWRGGRRGAAVTTARQVQRPSDRPRTTTHCGRCGTMHGRNACPAYGKRCLRCSKINHFARVCGVYFVEASDEKVIFSLNKDLSDWTIDLKINEHIINFKLDTGADVNVLPMRFLSSLGISVDKLLQSNTKLSGYSGDLITVIGKTHLKVYYKNKLYLLEFKIADVNSTPILGRYACVEMNLIKRVMSVQRSDIKSNIYLDYKDVFEGIGCLPGEYNIQLRDDAIPVVHAPRKLPFAISEDVKKKLLEMESQGIIAKVEGPSDWVSSITVVKKPNGDLRICLDPKELNQAIRREQFRLPTIDEIVSKLAGARYFSTLDASSGFWNVKLGESSKFCTFNTPFGRFKFLRMPYGICSASEVFHKKIYEHFDDIEGVCMYIDDLLIYAPDQSKHDEILKNVLERCRKINLKLNINKCKFGLQDIKYLGHRITKDGLSPDDSHLSAIKNMQVPKNKKDIERFLGLITYVGSFVPNLSDKTLPLRELLKKEIEWHWDERHEQCFTYLKTCLTKRPVLQYYSLEKPIIISVDASSTGLGACLMQNGLPVCYASKALTNTEQRYAQIEKELYASVFACERFNAYIFGRSDVTIETDHKPLISIIKKPIVDAPSRLQRMLLRLQRYTFTLVYRPGKHLYIADALSRAYETTPHMSEGMSKTGIGSSSDEVCVLTDSVKNKCEYLTDAQFVDIQKQLELDEEMIELHKQVLEGWPENKDKINNNLTPYWKYREDITIANGLIWKSDKIIIPKVMRSEMLKKIHIGHMGIEKCKLRAREIIFWPGINNDIENMIKGCNICLTHRKNNQKEELNCHEVPDRPWAKVGVDLFQYKGTNYLLLVDYFSKYFELIKLHSTISISIINHLKNIFCRQGIPNTIMSDCGPQFTSYEFRKFALDWNFTHMTSSPYYPQSNGQIERTVQTVKNIIKKSTEDNTDYRLALLECLNTPLGSDLASPAEILQSRKLRSIVPRPTQLLVPKVHNNIKEKLMYRQNKQKEYYDKSSKNLRPLQINQNIRYFDTIKNYWAPGVVERILRNRSYAIRLHNGKIVVRNRRHMIADYSHRHSRPRDYEFDYNDSKNSSCHTNEHRDPSSNNNYVTRSGRTVRPPNRWGYP